MAIFYDFLFYFLFLIWFDEGVETLQSWQDSSALFFICARSQYCVLESLEVGWFEMGTASDEADVGTGLLRGYSLGICRSLQ